ncbi:MAG: HAMP domain-containing sensor histidine kinase [Lachnospiraceae bacterium]|uniref:sensor histidine kinase n=1 Tax=Parablautia sp. Marseille-Q6255 TaxID=3039593 RepID=UPI0024BD2BA2|nr:HAMP domain-containing sensor histidine kinase [Parablautia sp. Marseille-Q6255]
MNISIRKQLTVVFAGLTVVLFLANFLVNTFFLEDFYYIQKQKVLREAYETLNENINDFGIMSTDDTKAYEQMCNENGISFVVTNEDYVETMWMKNMNNMDIILARLNGYGIGYDSGVVLEENEDYTIQKKYDDKLGLNFLEIWGRLDKGFYFLMRISIEGIQDSVRISNEFIKYICVIGVLFGSVIIWFVSKRVTQPLNRLTELSKRMADLDFDAKYTGGGGNEIGQLGEHFNRMSENLEKAYSQLLTANNELQKDIERKEQIDEMRKEFLSNVSHELKTPIALIQGYAEGLQECINDDEESREFYCDVIMDEAGKMNGLVQKLLTLNQLEFGNDQIVMERFDLAVLIQNKIQSVSILAQQKEADISYEGEACLPVWGDEFKVEEIITNYLSNALNHIGGAHKIRVSAACSADHVRVTVFNTGEQIPEEDIGRIWDKFYKVDKARTREYGGSGVGLSIVKAIMESFHQKYGVYNTQDGVAFWFELKDGNSDIEEKESGEKKDE